jgi:hypothetical protein
MELACIYDVRYAKAPMKLVTGLCIWYRLAMQIYWEYIESIMSDECTANLNVNRCFILQSLYAWILQRPDWCVCALVWELACVQLRLQSALKQTQ